MWVFKHDQRPNVAFGLIEGGKYLVGRSTFDCNNDNSVSRSHARVTVKNHEVFLEDLGSRYGTYVGEKAIVSSQNNSQEDRLDKGQESQVFQGQRVRFGLLSSLFKLQKSDFNICTSSLTNAESETVKTLVGQLGQGCKLFNKWSDGITHLIVNVIQIFQTPKITFFNYV